MIVSLMNAQDIMLHEQINGRYDFTFIGNTLNSAENNPTFGYITSTSSAAQLNSTITQLQELLPKIKSEFNYKKKK